MEYAIETNPPALFDDSLNRIETPNEMKPGYKFFITQKMHLTWGETVRNPFDVGPQHFGVEYLIKNAPRPELLLVEVIDIQDEYYGTCKVVAKFDDLKEVMNRIKNNDSLPKHSYSIREGHGPLQDGILGSLNELVKTDY